MLLLPFLGRKRRMITMLLLHNEDDEEKVGCATEVNFFPPPCCYNQINHTKKEALLCKIGRGFYLPFFLFLQHFKLHKPSLRFNSLGSFKLASSKSPKPPNEAK
jgi:hypothetical protein